MKRIAFLALILALPFGAYAQTVSSITSQTCNVQLSQCTLDDSEGNTVVVEGQWVYSGPDTISVVAPDGTESTRSCVASRTLISQTNYRIVSDLVIDCDDGSTLSGTYSASRSGSGRGGWAWHHHVSFEVLTLY